MPWPTSGMRSTSQLTMTMAVITGRLNYRHGCAVGRAAAGQREWVDRPQPAAGWVDGRNPTAQHGRSGSTVAGRRVSAPGARRACAGAADRAGPRAVHLDDPHAGCLEPAQDDLGLLRRGRGGRAGPAPRRPRRWRRGCGRRASGRRRRGLTLVPASRPKPDADQLPPAGVGAPRRDDLRAGASGAMRWVRAAARTRWSSRSRTVPASSNRSCSDRAAIRRAAARR